MNLLLLLLLLERQRCSELCLESCALEIGRPRRHPIVRNTVVVHYSSSVVRVRLRAWLLN